MCGAGPPPVVTVTSTTPLPAGEVAVIEVSSLTVNEAAAVVRDLTAVAPVKLVLVPPAGPVPTAVTVGTAMEVRWLTAR